MKGHADVVAYLTAITGTHPVLRSLPPAAGQLPLFMRHLYALRELDLFERRIVLAVAASDEPRTPAELAKHYHQLQRALSIPVALVLSRVTSYNRNRLVRMRVPFIVPGRQLFLPMLLVDLRETGLNPKTTRSRLSAGAQAVVIYRLLCGRVDELSFAELAHKLGYSAMTLTNAADELVECELAEVKSEGRKRHIDFPVPGLALWHQAESYLRSPVKSSHWAHTNVHGYIPLFEAGTSALAKISSLANDSWPVMAQTARRVKTWLRDGTFTECPDQDEANVCLQEWRYDPAPFAEANRVDRLSLFLTLRETDDERVRLALREMMEGVACQP